MVLNLVAVVNFVVYDVCLNSIFTKILSLISKAKDIVHKKAPNKSTPSNQI